MLKIFAGNSHIALARKIRENLEPCTLDKVTVGKFADGEIHIKDLENVRGADCFIIQPTQAPGDNLLELLFLADTLKRSSARSVTAVIPYFAYARSDRKDAPRAPIIASAVAHLLEAMGVDRILTMDLHSDQLEAIFQIPVDHLRAKFLLTKELKKHITDNSILVGPDIGVIKTLRWYAEVLKLPFAWIDKSRPAANENEVMSVNGADIKDKDLWFIDDMVDTGGTMIKGIRACFLRGAASANIVATHGIFGKGASKTLGKATINKLIITNTLPNYGNARLRGIMKAKGGKLIVVDTAPMFAKAIRNIYESRSLGELFKC